MRRPLAFCECSQMPDMAALIVLVWTAARNPLRILYSILLIIVKKCKLILKCHI